jgi:signal transduction histidine kinase
MEAIESDFWIARPKGVFEHISHYPTISKSMQKGLDLTPEENQTFLTKVRNNLIIHIDSQSENDGLESFRNRYLPSGRFLSWIGIQVIHEGKLFGLLGIQRKGITVINQFEELVLTTAGSLISQCYDSLLRFKEKEIRAKEFDRLVEERIDEEKEILIRKLTDHAFYTSHHIRHPLTTILALVELIKLSWDDREKYETYIHQLKVEAMNLDDAIRVMTAKIELD